MPDPELPPLDIGRLGMLHDLEVDDDGRVHVQLLPTFAGCPALDVIREDVEAAVGALEGVTSVTVRFRYDPPWTPKRIDDEGRERLRQFGITPPSGPVQRSRAVGNVDATRLLPVAGREPDTPRVCPYCGSASTNRDSAFGPTPCRSIHHCEDCRQPFEAFKDL